MKKNLFFTLTAIAVLLTLSGCLVEKKKQDVKSISRTTDNLRIYQPGDQIVYNFTTDRILGGGTQEKITGTLTVKWQQLTGELKNPFTDETYSDAALKQSLIYQINGSATTGPGIVRYIQQDSVTGAVSVIAVEDSAGDRFWFNEMGGPGISVVDPMLFFDSPLNYSGDSLIDFYEMPNCEGKANCDNPIGRYSNALTLMGDSTAIETNLGKFEDPIQVNQAGSITPFDGLSAPLLDIQHVCNTTGRDFVTHDSTAYFFPEIGIIQMTNTCTVLPNNDIEVTTYTLSGVNFYTSP
jgi:hypothetical protein